MMMVVVLNMRVLAVFLFLPQIISIFLLSDIKLLGEIFAFVCLDHYSDHLHYNGPIPGDLELAIYPSVFLLHLFKRDLLGITY